MLRSLSLFLLAPLIGTAVFAQSATPGTLQGTSSATLNVKPDQVQLDVSVVTQANTAAQAGQQNATQTAAMIAALQQVVGNAGNIQTVGYSIYPRYNNAYGQNSVIIGYTAQNTVEVTAYDLTKAGPLIDAANQAGAGSVGGLTFGLQDPEPSHLQVLTLAAKQAQAHAAAIAAGLGAKAGAVISAVEATASPVYTVPGLVAGASATTPILTGTVSVSATVTVTVQLVQ